MALRRHLTILGLLGLFALPLTGCFRWHIMPIEQGNVMTEQTLHRLHRGMTQAQVRKLLGAPLLNQVFDDGTVRYVYYYKPNSGPIHQRLVYLHFARGHIISIQTQIHERPQGSIWTRTHDQTNFVVVPHH